MKLIVIFALIFLSSDAKRETEEADSNETTDAPVIDRLAKNLAGAFVKSLLPDLEPPGKSAFAAQDLRRAPISYEQNSPMPNPNYYPPQYQFPNPYAPVVSGMYSPNVPPISAQMTQPYPNRALAFPPMSPIYPASGMPVAAEYQPFAVNGVTLNKMLGPLAAGNGDIESLNKARNEKYYADLQKHQQHLMQYGEKQLEYLDQQRRYQQAMLDQRAGAALMMQKQHQDLLKKRRNALKYLKQLEKQAASKRSQKSSDIAPMAHVDPRTHDNSYPEMRYNSDSEIRSDQQTGGQVLITAKEEDPSKQFAARDELDRHFPFNNGEDIATNARLKEFFKENYGIDVPENGAELTDDERYILRDLKRHLTSEAYNKALSKGVFKTMTDYKKTKIKGICSSRNSRSSHNNQLFRDYYNEQELSLPCEKCITINDKKLKGTWTQIYGNPAALRKIYSTIISLRTAPLKSGTITTTNLTKRKASCVGLQFGEAAHQSTSMRLLFRDDSRFHELYEMNGILKLNGTILEWDLNGLNMRMCVVKAGPKQVRTYEYIALTEIAGPNKCMSYHVYTRSSDHFHQNYYGDIASFMKTEVLKGAALPVAELPKPYLCEINDNDQME